MNKRKKLHPINSNDHSYFNHNSRITRSKNPDIEKNYEDNSYKPAKRIRYTLCEDNIENDFKLRKSTRQRTLSISTSSTESIPDSKSLFNVEHYQDNNHNVHNHHIHDQHVSIKDTNVKFYDYNLNIDPKQNVKNVNVPSWRSVNILKSCRGRRSKNIYTENFDDDIFIKRHEKFEQNEKKEYRTVDKFYSKFCKSHGNYRTQDFYTHSNQNKKWQNTLPQSFENNLKIKYISVQEKVPITAFGVNLKHINQTPFKFK